jgi:arginyl-tRNA synthetase
MTEATKRDATPLGRELERVVRELGAPDDFEPRVERPAERAHGDFASNAALVLAGRLGRPPRDIATDIADRFDQASAGVASVEVAGPGFLNFRMADAVLHEGLLRILASADTFGRRDTAEPNRINVEFVSANPTGPLHVAHGRGAAVGDAVATLLEWTGNEVVREFYVNDAGRQMDLLAESVYARMLQDRGEKAEVPEGGYQGAYVLEIARLIAAEMGAALDSMPADERLAGIRLRAGERLRAEQELDLADFGVHMDVFTEESSLLRDGAVQDLLDRLERSDYTYREEGALWLRTTALGDEKDRVLLKSDGSHTYLVSDIAYHIGKAERGFSRAIDVWGADHHGHIARMQAALSALAMQDFRLEVLLIQLVTIMQGGAEAKMSKRAGRFVTLRELFETTGTDVARYFFLMRRSEVPMSFDLDLAMDTSDANPVYKIQYAHARMCSVFERGGVDADGIAATLDELAVLDSPGERAVVTALLRLPDVVASAADARAPHQVCHYLEELASSVNAWYHEGNLDPARRVLADGPARPARLALARAVQITLRRGLGLLGLSAPERMTREEPS